MREESIVEYSEICGLVKEASSTVTRYSSIVIALSGGALFAVFRNFDSPNHLMNAFAAIFFAIITLALQLIINYRCNSHNRLAAYRNLIASEQFQGMPAPGSQMNKSDAHPAVAFDVCMDHLNHTYNQGEFRFDFVKDPIRFAREGVFKGLSENDDGVDRIVAKAFPKFVEFPDRPAYNDKSFERQDDNVARDFWGALRSYFAIICFRRRYDSTWSFPPYINLAISLIVILSLFSSSISMSFAWAGSESLSWIVIFYLSLYFSLIIIFLWFFYKNAISLQEIMIGCSTIYCYFKQFIPFRLIYINQKYGNEIKPYFLGIPWKGRQEKDLRNISRSI